MKEEQLLEALKAFPDLKKHMEDLLIVASNHGSHIELADDAEERILNVSPKLNRAALQAWAKTQSEIKSLDFSHRHTGARKDIKKN